MNTAHHDSAKPGLLVLLFTILVLLPVLSHAQRAISLPSDTLATIGSDVITARDLLRRLELMPFPVRSAGAVSETVKARALSALVAEKVLARASDRRGIQDDPKTALMKRELENVFMRDELYRREISGRASHSLMEITEGMNRITKNLRVLALLVRSAEEGKALSVRLRVANPDNILTSFPHTAIVQADTMTVRFGGPDTALENAAYTIGVSRVSKVFMSESARWAVLYLMDKTPNQDALKLALPDRRRRVEEILRSRHEQELGKAYTFELLKTRQAFADSIVFNILADSLSSLWSEDTSRFKNRGRFLLSGDLVDLLMERLGPSLKSKLVRIDDGGLTLEQVLEMFRYLDFTAAAHERQGFKIELNEAIKDAVAREFIAQEARRRGLQNTRTVRSDVQMWTDYWRARSLYYQILDTVSVSAEDVVRHLVKSTGVFGRSYQVNVREVLTESPGEMGSVITELDRGRPLESVARQSSLRKEWAARGGESGFFDLADHPELGARALMASDSGFVGPVRLPEGYSLFKVLGKRTTGRAKTSADSLRSNVRQRLLAEKKKDELDRYIAQEARAQSVIIHRERLKGIRLNQTPMFTRRFIGFGGRLAAFPLFMQLWDWIRYFDQPRTILP